MTSDGITSGQAGYPGGSRGLLRRVQSQVAGPRLRSVRFYADHADMLRFSRMIEAGVAGVRTDLYAGFGAAHRLVRQREVYRALTRGGTRVLGFGRGTPLGDTAGVEWHEVPDDPAALHNSWYRVTRGPQRVALVAFPRSAPSATAAEPDKDWEGFVSSDERMVETLIDVLDDLARTPAT